MLALRHFSLQLILTIGFLVCLPVGMNAGEQQPEGNSEIRAPLLESEVIIRTTNRLAGAIDSLTWRGKEFIDSTDHGRQLQSASNFDAGSPMVPETFNPTEAGSVFDGAGQTTTSRLLHLIAQDNQLQTTNQMAFWMTPGRVYQGRRAKNQTALSNHLLTKRVSIGWRNLPQVIPYEVTFHLPVDEVHHYAQFEVLTGYMPAEFERFWTYDPTRSELKALSDGPGEQSLPVILSTDNQSFAMGCWTPPRPLPSGWTGPGYGRFRFEKQHVVKWNCVYRYRNPQGIPPSDYNFQVYVIVGDMQLVTQGIRELFLFHQSVMVPSTIEK